LSEKFPRMEDVRHFITLDAFEEEKKSRAKSYRSQKKFQQFSNTFINTTSTSRTPRENTAIDVQ
ncbi:MAG TPA: hypothetical protein VGN34_21730, partial [Ktedonobacteraceae bacterium]